MLTFANKKQMKQIPDFPNYTLTDDGRVWSVKNKRFLRPSLNNSGYLGVRIYQNGLGMSISIHRAMALTYIDNPLNKATVNHIDGDKLNNRVDNLEWSTHKENLQHSIRVLKNPKPPTQKGNFGKDHNRSLPIYMYDKDGLFVREFGGLSEASRITGASISGVWYSAKNRRMLKGVYFFYENSFDPDTTHKVKGPRTQIQLR